VLDPVGATLRFATHSVKFPDVFVVWELIVVSDPQPAVRQMENRRMSRPDGPTSVQSPATEHAPVVWQRYCEVPATQTWPAVPVVGGVVEQAEMPEPPVATAMVPFWHV